MTTPDMIAELRKAGVLLEDDEDSPGLWLNLNDVFSPAADAERITVSDVPAIFYLWRDHGIETVYVWVRVGRECRLALFS